MDQNASTDENELAERVARHWAMRVLRACCPQRLYEEIEGDLMQRFDRECRTLGKASANRRLAWNAIRFIRPGIFLRHHWSLNLIAFRMIWNYLTIAARIMRRNIGYSVINILGLVLGMTGALLLGLWVLAELSYDHFQKDVDRVYIVWNRQPRADGVVACWSVTPKALAPALQGNYSGVELAVSFADYSDSYLFKVDDHRVLKNRANFVDADFLKVISFPLVSGDVNTALASPHSIVLTEQFARQLFGDDDAFGRTVTLAQGEYQFQFTVNGVLKDLPSNTDFSFEFLIPFSFIESNFGKEENWANNSVVTFVKARSGADVAILDAQIRDLKKKHIEGETTELFLYPFFNSHLYSRFENGVPSGGRIEIVRMIGLLAVILVVIACINFINLSTARASRRAREVAVRKVTGAFRSTLVAQFLCESTLVAFIAAVISIVAGYLLLPAFNVLVSQQLHLDLQGATFWIFAVLAVLTISVLAGGYPAFYLSSLVPSKIIKGFVPANRSVFRSVLVIVQFGFALALIVSAIIVFRQTNFLQQRNIGYDRDNLIYQNLTGTLERNFAGYREELLASGFVASVTRTSSPITQRMSNTTGMYWRGKDPSASILIERLTVDEDLAVTMGVQIVQGRDLDLDRYPTDSTAALINESAMHAMGFTDPIGEVIEDDGMEARIVGVVKDFVFSSPYKRVEPIVMFGSRHDRRGGVVHMKLNAGRPATDAINAISDLAKKYNPDYPFEYQFVDQEYARKFANEEMTLSVTTIFSGLAIFIGCLGLLGLSTYLVEARMKEIGIRKVLGGSVVSIIRLLSGHALRPIMWAVLLSAPAAWWTMEHWLETYEYRIAFSWWTIPLAASAILLMALLTIVFQIHRAARTNPVTTLKSE